jgi:fatty acid-binding protein DegV
VPGYARTLARLFRLSVILATQPDGRVAIGGVLWGRHRLLERFARFVAQRAPGVRHGARGREPGAAQLRYRMMIGHGNASEAATRLARELASALPTGSVTHSTIAEMGTALGVHGGTGTLIVGVHAT